MSDYPDIIPGRTERLPSDGVRRCGSSLAHAACRFAGQADGDLLRCDASGPAWSDCPYHASGFINVFTAAAGWQ
jgi:hypothetical protein